ncbi:MAG: hypothetical protein PHE66_07860, partial [Syntrophaceticus schinkii]|nr:hypothetical protein [Syntrophaceticus schinkii]
QIARSYLKPLQEAGVDTLVFGCTHYPFLAPVIRHIMGETIHLVDPATEVVMKLTDILKPDGHAGKRPQSLFYASGPVTSFYTAGREFLGSFPFTVQQVSLDDKGTGVLTQGPRSYEDGGRDIG